MKSKEYSKPENDENLYIQPIPGNQTEPSKYISPSPKSNKSKTPINFKLSQGGIETGKEAVAGEAPEERSPVSDTLAKSKNDSALVIGKPVASNAIYHMEMGHELDFEFEEGEMDNIRERFEIMAIKMDVHKTGTLYLRELDIILQELSEAQRTPIGEFLIQYMRQTKKITMKLKVFVDNIFKAYQMDKFSLRSIPDMEEDLETILSQVNNVYMHSSNQKNSGQEVSNSPLQKEKTKGTEGMRTPQSKNHPATNYTHTKLSLREKIECQKQKLKKKEERGIKGKGNSRFQKRASQEDRGEWKEEEAPLFKSHRSSLVSNDSKSTCSKDSITGRGRCAQKRGNPRLVPQNGSLPTSTKTSQRKLNALQIEGEARRMGRENKRPEIFSEGNSPITKNPATPSSKTLTRGTRAPYYKKHNSDHKHKIEGSKVLEEEYKSRDIIRPKLAQVTKARTNVALGGDRGTTSMERLSINRNMSKDAEDPWNQQQVGEKSECMTERALRKNLLRRREFGSKLLRGGLPPNAALTSKDKEFLQCTFKPDRFGKKRKFQNVQPRLLNHLKEAESINEGIEYIYEKSPMEFYSLNMSMGSIGNTNQSMSMTQLMSANPKHMSMSIPPERNPFQGEGSNTPQHLNRNLSMSLVSDKGNPSRQRANHSMTLGSLTLGQNLGRGGKSPQHSTSILGEEHSVKYGNSINLELSAVANQSRSSTWTDISNSVLNRSATAANPYARVANMFDVKSERTLGDILKHGYAYKYHEKKQYNAVKAISSNRTPMSKKYINTNSIRNLQRQELFESKQEGPISYQPKGGFNLMLRSNSEKFSQLKPERSHSASGVSSRFKLMNMEQGEFIGNDLKEAKKKTIMKGLHMSGGLKEVFSDMNSRQLMEIRKLHVIYAANERKKQMTVKKDNQN